MKQALTKIKQALAQHGIVEAFTQYRIEGGEISAYNGRFTASCPIDNTSLAFAVPGREFEALVSRLPEDAALSVADSVLRLKAGRQHGTIKLLPLSDATQPRPSAQWRTPPASLIPALQAARPFISDNAVYQWALCASLESGLVRATNNVCLVEAMAAGLDATGQLLPLWVIDYLLSRDESLTGFQLTDSHVSFKWSDDSWMRAQLVDGAFPEVTRTVFEQFLQPAWAIPAEWKQAYRTVAELSAEAVTIAPAALSGGHGAATIEHEIETPVAEEVKFNPKFLTSVIETATHWEPSAYPRPTPFAAPGLRGFVIGRR